MGLTKYIKKRNFKDTSEPRGKVESASQTRSFVIQRHDASRLHYDFRLELDGVLKSWAIPKGPSLNPRDKRLAVEVEDHPLAYGSFEGTIPQGNYGAGEVEIWDKGTYTLDPPSTKNDSPGIRRGLRSGSLKFTLHGNILNGSFALVRLKNGKGNNWLLIKHRDEFADDDYDIESQKNRKKAIAKHATSAKAKPASVRSSRFKERKYTDNIKPMLASITDKPFDDEDWIFELKWDGYRAIAEITGQSIKLYSRNGLSFNDLYPEVADELTKIKTPTIIDGEIVVLGEDGKPNFQKLQHFSENRSLPIVYHVFDCLSHNGQSLTDLPLLERKKILQSIIPESALLKYSDHVKGTGVRFFREAVKLNLEGVLAKQCNSLYEVGRRTKNWLKVKNHNTQEAVIAGYTSPKASRKYFGSLVLGVYKRGKLKYIGHTGTGFTKMLLEELYNQFQPLIRNSSPFDTKIPLKTGVTWIEPNLVCNVKFTELTEEGILRHPVFMGLRVDKSAHEVDHIDADMKTTSNKSKKTVSHAAGKETSVKVNGHTVKLTNQQKIFWPDDGYTKGDVINYYTAIADYILPYLKDRPQSLKRNPNGIHDKGFFHKNAGDNAPEWVKHIAIYSDSSRRNVEYILCNNKATLLYLANLGCIEINPWNSRIRKPDYPDYLIMDIDPSAENSYDQVIDVALTIKELLDKAGAQGYCKTSGASGIHIYIPMHAAYTYDDVRIFAERLALMTVEALPDLTTTERSLKKRNGRIYIDYLQNSRGQTLSSVYSIRPVAAASVSTPLAWNEVKHGLTPQDFTIKTIHKRLKKKGDLFRGVLENTTNIKKCLKNLDL